MLTWRLWHALSNPQPHNSLFRRGINRQQPAQPVFRTLRVTVIYLAACLLVSLVWPLLISNAAGVMLFAAAAGNTLYSMMWAASIGSVIAYEREMATYDLLCLMPGGSLGAGWAIATARLHRSGLFQFLRLAIRLLATALLSALVLTMLIPLVVLLTAAGPAVSGLFVLLEYGLIPAAAFYLDHVQSLTLAHIIGMIVPTYAGSRINARLWSAAGFLVVQMLVYLITLIAGLVVVPRLLAVFQFPAPISGIILPIIQLGLFYCIREILIARAWRLMLSCYNASQSEFSTIFSLPGYRTSP